MRIIIFISLVLMPMPFPATLSLNSVGVIISGPFSLRPYLNMLSLRPLRYADHYLHFVGLNAYAIPRDLVVELRRSHHLGAFQPSSVSEYAEPPPAAVCGSLSSFRWS